MYWIVETVQKCGSDVVHMVYAVEADVRIDAIARVKLGVGEHITQVYPLEDEVTIVAEYEKS